MSKRGQEPAYPVEVTHGVDNEMRGAQTGAATHWHTGMSVRLRIASEQMAAVITAGGESDAREDFRLGVPDGEPTPAEIGRHIAFTALAYADALLAAEEESR